MFGLRWICRRIFGRKKTHAEKRHKDAVEEIIDIYLAKNGLLNVGFIPDFLERAIYHKIFTIILDQLSARQVTLFGTVHVSMKDIETKVVDQVLDRGRRNKITRLHPMQINMIQQTVNYELENALMRRLIQNIIIIVCAFLFDSIQLISFSCMGLRFRLEAQVDKAQVQAYRKAPPQKRILSEEEQFEINEAACHLAELTLKRFNISFVPDELETNIYYKTFSSIIYLALKILNTTAVNVLGIRMDFEAKILTP